MKPRNQQRPPQRSLFDVAPRIPPAARWCDGTAIDYLGGSLYLKLDTDRRQAMREGGILHLPLPPDADERQIQDAAESWLRREAEGLFARLIGAEVQRSGRDMPALSLSFSVRGSWTKMEGRTLRLNWRLIEQPLAVIELTLRRAVIQLPTHAAPADLFSLLT